MGFRHAFIVIALVSLSGCTSMFANETSISKLNFEDRKNTDTSATVIFSAGTGGNCFFSHPVFIHLIKDDAKRKISYYTANNEFIKPELSENHGFLHAANISPGDYSLTLNIPTKKTISAPVAKVRVSANDLIYFGEIFINSGCAASGSSDEIQIRNRAERDLAKAAELNPAIDPAKVDVRILQFERDEANN